MWDPLMGFRAQGPLANAKLGGQQGQCSRKRIHFSDYTFKEAYAPPTPKVRTFAS